MSSLRPLPAPRRRIHVHAGQHGFVAGFGVGKAQQAHNPSQLLSLEGAEGDAVGRSQKLLDELRLGQPTLLLGRRAKGLGVVVQRPLAERQQSTTLNQPP